MPQQASQRVTGTPFVAPTVGAEGLASKRTSLGEICIGSSQSLSLGNDPRHCKVQTYVEAQVIHVLTDRLRRCEPADTKDFRAGCK